VRGDTVHIANVVDVSGAELRRRHFAVGLSWATVLD
jgi:hypothetical protein